MSKICEVCGKAPSAGRNVSHSHRVTNRWFRPNIQRVTIKDKEGHVRKDGREQGPRRIPYSRMSSLPH